MRTGQQYTLVLAALDEPTPAAIRLRHVLKSLLRHWGFRCIEVKEGPLAVTDAEVDRLRTAVEELAGRAAKPP